MLLAEVLARAVPDTVPVRLSVCVCLGEALALGQGDEEKLPEVEGVLELLSAAVDDCAAENTPLAVARAEPDVLAEPQAE